MAYSNILPRTKNITGSDCSGTDGTADRTYTLPETAILSSGLDLVINGTTLMEGASYDFTLVSNVVTFLNIVDDSDIIRISYWISPSVSSESALSTSTSLKYATPTMLANVIGVKKTIPSWDAGESPSNEAVGTGEDYPSTGTIIIGSEVITYTGTSTDDLTGCTRGALGSTAATHDDEDEVHSTVLFISNTTEGTAVTWIAQPWDTQMNATDTGGGGGTCDLSCVSISPGCTATTGPTCTLIST